MDAWQDDPTWIYLDWNATSPLAPEVAAAMSAAAERGWANPSSPHGAGRAAMALVEGARAEVARSLAIHTRDLAFTSGGSEANNLALHAVDALALTRLEHPSIVRVAERLQLRGRPVEWLPVLPAGTVDVAALEPALSRLGPSATVALMAVNHETGVIQPLQEVGEIVRACGARLHVDAVQGFGKLAAELWQGADSIAVAAHKLRGPKGIGALAWRGRPPEPLLVGGGQERGLRPGTQAPVLCEGFAAAVRRRAAYARERGRLSVLRARIESRLRPWARVNGLGERLAHVSNLSMSGWRGDEFVAALDLQGVHLSSGSACAAGTAETSPVITAMVGPERAASAVRISMGDATQDCAVDRAIDAMITVLCAHDGGSSGIA